MNKKLYFVHPVNVYNTRLEVNLIEKIKIAFPDWEIENPAETKHNEGYKEWQEKTGRGMNYFFNIVLPECQGGVFLPFRDGAWGIGVFGEAEFLSKKDLPIWQISSDGEISEINLKNTNVLSIEKTRLRIRFASGETKPYFDC